MSVRLQIAFEAEKENSEMFLRNFSDSVLFNLSRFLFLFLFPPFPSISSELVWLLGKLTKFSANSIIFFPALFILRFRVKLNCRSFSVTDKTYQLCIVLLPNYFLSLSQQPNRDNINSVWNWHNAREVCGCGEGEARFGFGFRGRRTA